MVPGALGEPAGNEKGSVALVMSAAGSGQDINQDITGLAHQTVDLIKPSLSPVRWRSFLGLFLKIDAV